MPPSTPAAVRNSSPIPGPPPRDPRRSGRRWPRAPRRSPRPAGPPAPTPVRSASATRRPTTWCAARNGTPRRTSASATAVAVVNPSSAAARIRSRSTVSVATHPGHDPERGLERRRRLEQRRLVLLEVALVGQRQPLEQGQDPGQRADDPGRPAADELGRVGVLLVRHHRAAGRERVGHADEPEARVRPPGHLLGEPAEVDHRRAPPRRGSRPRSRGRDGVERVRRDAVEPELARPSPRGRAGSPRRPARRRRAARRWPAAGRRPVGRGRARAIST